MRLKTIIRKLVRGRVTPEQRELNYAIKNGLKLGKNVRNYSPYSIDSEWPWLISIGDNTMISTNVKILAHDASTGFLGIGTKVGRVDIGKNCFIGCGSIILCGTKIGDNVIVGAGSIVTKDLEPDCVYAGNPARKICTCKELREKYLNKGIAFDHYRWNEWINAPAKDKEEMYKQCDKNIGFVK